jgi:hypothetical protein
MKDRYVEDFLRPMRKCLDYKPAFGTSSQVSSLQFIDKFSQDFFYASVGLAIPEMYVAHKAAGGITSFYRQLGIACEQLTQSVFVNELGIVRADVRWTYVLPRSAAGKSKLI